MIAHLQSGLYLNLETTYTNSIAWLKLKIVFNSGIFNVEVLMQTFILFLHARKKKSRKQIQIQIDCQTTYLLYDQNLLN